MSTLLCSLNAYCVDEKSDHDSDPYAPVVSAKGYLIMEYNTGQIIANIHGDDHLEPASITKVMTAYVVFKELKKGSLKLTDSVLISLKSSAKRGSRTFLKKGSRVTVETLIKGMIIQSGNDAAIALSEHIAGDEDIFVEMMNREANLLKMRATFFVNATGWPVNNHRSSARDLAILARAMIKEFPEYYKYYSTKEFSYRGVQQTNRNMLLHTDPRVDGLKTGHTNAAGYCLLASAKSGTRRLITIVLGDKSNVARAVSSKILINYGFNDFAIRKIVKKYNSIAKIRLYGGETRFAHAGLKQDTFLALRKKQPGKVMFSYTYNRALEAPVRRNQEIGKLTISVDNQMISEHPLIALHNVGRGNWFHRFADSLILLNK